MKNIALLNLFYALIPLLFVAYIYYKYTNDKKEILYASLRMFVQLLGIGYLLVYIFSNEDIYLAYFILFFMLCISAIITIRNTQEKNIKHYCIIFLSLALSCLSILFLIVFIVLELQEYQASIIIPIAGMIFATAMNTLSIGVERFEKEYERTGFRQARNVAFKSCLIPQINSYLAVGLVALPGMMTGQILSGIDPLIAVRYQIMVMLMLFSSSGLAVILYFFLLHRYKVYNTKSKP